MKVCIAEKPSVAREIASVLKANKKQDGYFEGNGYWVTWGYGHLCQLKEPEDYDAKWKQWKLENLPIFPNAFSIKLLPGANHKKQFSTIRKLIKAADEIIGCCDAGQEGEVIQRWIVELTGIRKPMKRLWISSLTEDAIRDGFSQLQPASLFDPLFEAGKSRAIGDWLLGMNATRLYTKKFGTFKEGVLSVGRVQTPTLALIVQRNHEIQTFVPSPYWELKTLYRQVVFNYSKGKFTKEEEGQQVFHAIVNNPLKIINIVTKQGKEPPPFLYDLTTIQRESNQKFALSAEKTLKLLQSLYEKKLITYPRVDTQFLPDDLYPKITPTLKGLRNYQSVTQFLLNQKIPKPRRVFNNLKVTDHHAIIPTGKTPKQLPPLEMKLYDRICKRFIAAFYPNCIFSLTTVSAEIQTFPFKATGKQILDPGWRTVYGKEDPTPSTNKKDKELPPQVLPLFEKGEEGPHRPNLEKKMTKPPRQYTEASLLYAMETAGKGVDDEELKQLLKENGIGRPATRASIIETLLNRKYIVRQKKSLLPTQKGIDLIQKITDHTLKSAELTGQWEKRLRAIEAGTDSSDQFLNDMQRFVLDLVNDVKSRENTPTNSQTSEISPTESLGNCPQCQAPMVETDTYHCTNFNKSCDFFMTKTLASQPVTRQHLQALLAEGRTSLIRGFRGNTEGQTFDAYLVLKTADGKSQILFDFPAPQAPRSFGTCPKCGTGQVIAGKKAWGCSNWRSRDGACDFRVWYTRGGVKLKESHLRTLLQGKTTCPIHGFKSQYKKTFSAALQLNAQHEVEYVFK